MLKFASIASFAFSTLLFTACGKHDRHQNNVAPTPVPQITEHKMEPLPVPDDVLEAISDETSPICRALIESFGLKTLGYSYKNFQGLMVDVTPKYKIDPQRCISNSEGISLIVRGAWSPEPITLTFTTSKQDGKLVFAAQNSGNCSAVAPKNLLNYLRNNNYVIVESVEISIIKSYQEEGCPALQKALTEAVNEVYANSTK